ncbi:Cytochrome 89A9 [Capsicum chinense]|nr:Cytochrome 89A9 [Capsicum chinense]
MDYVEAQKNYGIEEENKVYAVNLDEDDENIGETPTVGNANVRSESVNLPSRPPHAPRDRKTTSIAWQFFERISDTEVQCKNNLKNLLQAAAKQTTIPNQGEPVLKVREMGLNPNMWEDLTEFKLERFLMGDHREDSEMLDITGSREIEMMPFSVGTRICPSYDFSMFHLEYFVANLIWHFEWKLVEGDDVDLNEEMDFTFTMKNLL